MAIACVRDAYTFNKRIVSLPHSVTCYSSKNNNFHILIVDPHFSHCLSHVTLNSVFVNITINDKLWTIGTQYSPPSGDLEEDLSFTQKAFPMFSKYLLFVGDFNAHSPLWGYPRDDERGRILANFSFHNN